MNKFIVSAFLILTAGIAKCQYDFSQFPSYDKVVTEFFNIYSAPEILKTGKIIFEKHPFGWNVSCVDYSTNQVIKNNPFWSKKKKKFLETDFPKTEYKKENEDECSDKLNDWSKIWYRIYPYWGYPGSDWDIIQRLKEEKNLPDTLLFALGKAYSNYSMNVLNDNSGFSAKEHRFVLPQG